MNKKTQNKKKKGEELEVLTVTKVNNYLSRVYVNSNIVCEKSEEKDKDKDDGGGVYFHNKRKKVTLMNSTEAAFYTTQLINCMACCESVVLKFFVPLIPYGAHIAFGLRNIDIEDETISQIELRKIK